MPGPSPGYAVSYGQVNSLDHPRVPIFVFCLTLKYRAKIFLRKDIILSVFPFLSFSKKRIARPRRIVCAGMSRLIISIIWKSAIVALLLQFVQEVNAGTFIVPTVFILPQSGDLDFGNLIGLLWAPMSPNIAQYRPISPNIAQYHLMSPNIQHPLILLMLLGNGEGWSVTWL